MRKCFQVVCALLAASCGQRGSPGSWNSKSGKFDWWAGEVTLPVGFEYRADPSDTFAGHFTSPDGNLVIRHDIGGYAGAYASRRSAFFFQKVVDGGRVWTGKQDWPSAMGGTTTLVAVTFPDTGCANFYLESTKNEDAAVIASIARSFRRKGNVEPNEPNPLCR